MSDEQKPPKTPRLARADEVVAFEPRTSKARSRFARGSGKGYVLAEEKKEELRQLLLSEPHISRNEAARRLGLGQATVTRHAEAMGHMFDRARTAEAAKARVVDGRQRRAELANLLVEDALVQRQHFEDEDLDPRGRADIARAVGSLVRSVTDLDAADLDRQRAESGRGEGSEVDSWLQHMTGTGE